MELFAMLLMAVCAIIIIIIIMKINALSGSCDFDGNGMRYIIVAAVLTAVLCGLLFIILLEIMIRKGKLKLFVGKSLLVTLIHKFHIQSK